MEKIQKWANWHHHPSSNAISAGMGWQATVGSFLWNVIQTLSLLLHRGGYSMRGDQELGVFVGTSSNVHNYLGSKLWIYCVEKHHGFIQYVEFMSPAKGRGFDYVETAAASSFRGWVCRLAWEPQLRLASTILNLVKTYRQFCTRLYYVGAIALILWWKLSKPPLIYVKNRATGGGRERWIYLHEFYLLVIPTIVALM